MAQERFADVVERFTSGFNGAAAAVSPEVAKQWQEELERNVRRMTNLGAPGAPRPSRAPARRPARRSTSGTSRGCTGTSRAGTHRTPVLFVPNLGISRPYIFDLLPGGSLHRAHDPRGLRLLPARLGRLRPRGQRPHLRGLRGEDPAAHGRARCWRPPARASSPCSATAWARRCRPRSWPRIPRSRSATSSTWRARSTSRRSGCSGSGSTPSTSTSTASWTRSAPSRPTW